MIEHRYIIIFDGVCHFCNAAVNFIIDRDPNALFVFTPMQSDLAKQLTAEHQIDNIGMDTFVLIKQGQSFVRTQAALEIAKDLSGCWSWFRVLKIIPIPIRDIVYRGFARYRYTLFGRRSACRMPTPEIASRFIGV